MSRSQEILNLFEGALTKTQKDLLKQGTDIGHGWKFLDDFPPAVIHPKFGYVIMRTYKGDIAGNFWDKGDYEKAAKHTAFIHHDRSDSKAMKDLDQR